MVGDAFNCTIGLTEPLLSGSLIFATFWIALCGHVHVQCAINEGGRLLRSISCSLSVFHWLPQDAADILRSSVWLLLPLSGGPFFFSTPDSCP